MHVVILKRKQVNNSVKNLKEHRSKIVYTITIFIAQNVINKIINSKCDFIVINKKNNNVSKLIIFILKT